MPPADSTELVRVGAAEIPLLRQLFEYYLYDFSELLGTRVGPNGAFVREEKWQNELARPNVDRWLVRCGDTWSGFVIIAHESWLDGRAGVHDVDEFFVLRSHRRRGVGRDIATSIFARYVGPWEVRVLESNSNAAAFWRSVIDGFARGRYVEKSVDSPRWKGPVFSFSSAGDASADGVSAIAPMSRAAPARG